MFSAHFWFFAHAAEPAITKPSGKIMNYENYFRDTIKKVKGEGRYRVFIDILRNVQNFPKATKFTGSFIYPKFILICSLALIERKGAKEVTKTLKPSLANPAATPIKFCSLIYTNFFLIK